MKLNVNGLDIHSERRRTPTLTPEKKLHIEFKEALVDVVFKYADHPSFKYSRNKFIDMASAVTRELATETENHKLYDDRKKEQDPEQNTEEYDIVLFNKLNGLLEALISQTKKCEAVLDNILQGYDEMGYESLGKD